MTEPIAIRMLTPDDRDLLARAEPEVFDGPVDPALAAAFLDDPRHHMVGAIAGARLAGFVSAVDHVHPDKPRELWISEVSVAPRLRRRGIGRRLIAAMLDHARGLGCRAAWVLTEADNAPARALYAAAGGRLSGSDVVMAEFDLAAVTVPDDATLTERGMARPPTPSGRVLIIACGALAREILALKRLNGWGHMDLQCLPAILHNRPERIPDAVEAAVTEARPRYARIFVAYADCGTGGLLAGRCRALGVEMIAGPHCYSFFDGNEAFAARGDAEMRAFYLTDFLVRQFDAFVWRPMGLDRHPELRDQIFAGYETLVYLAQTDDPGLDAEARRCAARLGLAYARRLTGYGDLAAALADLR